MAVFRIEKTRDYTVMSNYHLRDMSLSLKAKGLLSLMLSLPENWDYTMKGLARICKDGIDSISGGIRELEAHGYLVRARVRSANGQLGSIEYTILEQPKAPSPTQEKPIRENPVQANPMLDAPIQENPAQLNKEESSNYPSKTDLSITQESSPILSSPPAPKERAGQDGIRKRRTNNGEHNMFSGLLVCADCGSNLHFHFNQGNPEIKYFNCSNYKGNRGTCTSTHYVRVDFLEEVVLGEIRRLTKFASLYEDEFVKAVIGHSQQAEQTDRKLKEKELQTLLARDEELDGLFERIYEDNVSGKLSDDRFAKMSRRYEDEQKDLSEKIKKLRSEIEKQSSRSMTTDMFIGLVRKYTRARKLTPRMLNELIEKIEVFNAEKIDGVWEQRLRIHYNCVGTIEIPTVLPLPIPEVSVNTRKGVVVNYAPCELAV